MKNNGLYVIAEVMGLEAFKNGKSIICADDPDFCDFVRTNPVQLNRAIRAFRKGWYDMQKRIEELSKGSRGCRY